MKPGIKVPENIRQAWAQIADQKHRQIVTVRLSWWAHWASLAEMFLPRRYRWLIQPNQWSRGNQMNQSIVDETGVLAARILATGLLAGMTSPTKPWFALALDGTDDTNPGGAVGRWLQSCSRIVLQTLDRGGFYTSMGVVYHDAVVFGSACNLQYEDAETVVAFINPCLGEFGFAVNAKNEVDTVSREYTYTIDQACQEFGIENLSPSTQAKAKQTAGGLYEIIICHLIEPNTCAYYQSTEIPSPVPPKFTFRETYWEKGSADKSASPHILRVSGINENCIGDFRWDVTSNDPYGRSPGMDALPAVRQLQIEQRRKAEGIDKMVRPPMVASITMRNEPADLLPGGITYVADVANSGMKPAYTVEPRVQELMEDLKEVQNRVQKVLFNDLFMGISQLGTVRSATEIVARQQETLVQLGPVIERTQRTLSKIIERTFAICARRGLIPPPPPELVGANLQIKYVSMFAETQRAAATAAIERLIQMVGAIAGMSPEAIDTLDWDQMVETYASELNVPVELLRDVKDIAVIRAQRQQAQAMQAKLSTGAAAATAAKTMSETDVGGGQNALQLMLAGNNAAPPQLPGAQ